MSEKVRELQKSLDQQESGREKSMREFELTVSDLSRQKSELEVCSGYMHDSLHESEMVCFYCFSMQTNWTL